MIVSELRLISGGRHKDVRGALRFCNDFNMRRIKRFYTVAHSASQPQRGWIMHKKETKWFFPFNGQTTIHIKPDDVGASSLPSVTMSFTLVASAPAVLQVPPSNWFCIEQDGASEVMVFTNCLVGEFQNDDYRRPL